MNTNIVGESCSRSWLVVKKIVYNNNSFTSWSTKQSEKTPHLPKLLDHEELGLSKLGVATTYMTAPPVRLVKLPLAHLGYRFKLISLERIFWYTLEI